jgi:hypothetical protein
MFARVAVVALVPIQGPRADSSSTLVLKPPAQVGSEGDPLRGGIAPPSMYRMNSWRALSASLLVAKPLLLFWRLLPVMGWRPMSTMNSRERRFRTCPLTAASFADAKLELSTEEDHIGGPADFASAAPHRIRTEGEVANGVPTATSGYPWGDREARRARIRDCPGPT